VVYLLYNAAEDVRFEFEFDPDKSAANKIKHGIDFVEAQRIWLDVNRWESAARAGAEVRFFIVGALAGATWTAVITYRGQTIRIISVRRARREEVQAYGRRGVR